MSLLYATTNEGKYRHLQSSLKKIDIELKWLNIEIPEIRSESIEKIAKSKAEYIFATQDLSEPVLVNDSGFCMPRLNNFPGQYSGYVTKTLGLDNLAKLIEDGEKAFFATTYAYKEEGQRNPIVFNEKIHGSITNIPRGTKKSYHWSPLVRIFIPEGHSKTLAEMSRAQYTKIEEEIYNSKSSAINKFIKWYKTNKTNQGAQNGR